MSEAIIRKIAIASGKGGTGKTLLSTNLAVYLSKLHPTLLVDLDVEEPNDHLFIKGNLQKTILQNKYVPEWDESQCTLCGKCSDTCRFHAIIRLGESIVVFKELCHSCYACSELCPSNALPMIPQKIGVTREFNLGNLRLVESCMAIGNEQAVPLIHNTLDLVHEQFNHAVITLFDCPPGTSCPIIAATRDADFVILITEPTPFGMHDFRLTVEAMRKLKKRFAAVINRHDIGDNLLEQYCTDENIPVIAKIPYEPEIYRLYSDGSLIYGNSEVMDQSLEAIADYILQLQEN